MESIFAIPCIVNNQFFTVLSFTDIRFEYSQDLNFKGVKHLNRKQRDEIDQLVALIANLLYKSHQKQKNEAAYK